MVKLSFRPGSVVVYARGLKTSITENAVAYGYSVSITVALAATISLVERPDALDLFLFVLGAAVSFALVELAATWFLREVRPEPEEVAEVGSILSIFSIGLALGAAVLVGSFIKGWIAWPLASFAASLVYVVTRGIEIGVSAPEEEDE